MTYFRWQEIQIKTQFYALSCDTGAMRQTSVPMTLELSEVVPKRSPALSTPIIFTLAKLNFE
jgi:hypothetical protein